MQLSACVWVCEEVSRANQGCGGLFIGDCQHMFRFVCDCGGEGLFGCVQQCAGIVGEGGYEVCTHKPLPNLPKPLEVT